MSKYNVPIFGSKIEDLPLNNEFIGKDSIDSKIAHQIITDELINEGNSRLNLATFCQTYMEDEAVDIMSNNLSKNMIDKTEYPRAADIEQKCVNIIANLWNAPKDMEFIGTSTIGSSEACMLGGMAMKFLWEENAKKNGVDLHKQKPNLVISSGYQVCWEKFCVYFDIEMRTVPLSIDDQTMELNNICDYFDDYTIGVVGILGITYNGKFDDIKELDKIIEKYNKTATNKLSIHVDAASGGMFVPFVHDKLEWDFRLKNVVSINTLGHKYGLVYPGVGWIIWKDKSYLPEKLIFDVSYLGGTIPTIAINFSRSASNVLGQYYNLLRYGFDGYEKIHKRTRDVAIYISDEVEKMEIFEICNDGKNMPVVCWTLKNDANVEWTLYDLTDRLRMNGWQVPTYALPPLKEDVIVQRVVCRGDFGRPLAEQFIADLKEAIKELNESHLKYNNTKTGPYGFTH